MDNLTHTLIGLAAGEAVAQSTRADRIGLPSQARRTLFVVLAAVGGNLPDLDLLYSYFGAHSKLDYLLEHRGYTHSVLGCLLLAALLYAGAHWWMRVRHLQPSARDRLELAIVAVFGTLLHIAMDSLNSYGIHPFWPFQNRWLYGDSVFIVEPLYWIAVAPLFFVVQTRLARVVLGLVLVAAIVAGIVAHGMSPAWGLGFSIAAATLVLLGKQTSARTASLTSAALTVAVTAAFISGGSVAARVVDSLARVQFSSERLLDHVLTPTPTNPLCWDVLMLGIDGDRYTVRHAMLSVAPGMVPASGCTNVLASGSTTASFEKVSVPDVAQIHWLGQLEMSRARLVELVASHCEGRELMQFARAPFIAALQHDWVLGDLRFDREAGLGMAEVALPAGGGEKCSHHVPWVPPRSDLLAR